MVGVETLLRPLFLLQNATSSRVVAMVTFFVFSMPRVLRWLRWSSLCSYESRTCCCPSCHGTTVMRDEVRKAGE